MGVPSKLDNLRVAEMKKLIENDTATLTDLQVQVPYDRNNEVASDGMITYSKSVYKIGPHHLRFNPENGRAIDTMDKSIRTGNQGTKKGFEKFARNFLANAISSGDRAKIERQLKKNKQLTPVIALADGTVLDGNTRMASIVVDVKSIKKINVFFLGEDIPMEQAELIEWDFSYEETYSKPWSAFQRGFELLKKLRNTYKEKPTVNRERLQAMLDDKEILPLLKRATWDKLEKGEFKVAITNIQAVLEAEEFVRRYNKAHPKEPNHPVSWIDKDKNSFTAFQTDIVPFLDKAQGKTDAQEETAKEKLRKMAHCIVNKYLDDGKGRLVSLLRPVSSAAAADQETLFEKGNVTAANCFKKETADNLIAEATNVSKRASSQRRKNQIVDDFKKIAKDLEDIKESKLNKNNISKIRPYWKRIVTRATKLNRKFNRK